VLLPAGLWQGLTDEQRDTLLVHELAHLRRFDHWVRRLELVVVALYWWHPVVWWARHELQEAEEQCCDAWVVWALPAAAAAYAAALVETVTFLSHSKAPLPLGASGMTQVDLLKRRLSMIMGGTTPRMLPRLGFLAILILAAGLLPLTPSWAEPQISDDSSTPAASERTGEESAKPKVAQSQPKGDQPDKPNVGKGSLEGPRSAKPKAGSGKSPTKPSSSDLSDAAREELELLQVQLDAKKAEVQEATARLVQGKVELDRLTRLQPQNLVSSGELARARSEVEVLTARLVGKEAQLREAEIRLRYAQRRLAPAPATGELPKGVPLVGESTKDFGEISRGNILLHRFVLTNRSAAPVRIAEVRTSSASVTAKAEPTIVAAGKSTEIVAYLDTSRFLGTKTFHIFVSLDPPQLGSVQLSLKATTPLTDATTDRKNAGTSTKPPVSVQNKLQEMEKKLDDLRKEIELLRKAQRPPQAGAGPALVPPDGFVCTTRSFRIPFRMDQDRVNDIKEVVLFCSADQGKTWLEAARATPHQSSFEYHAPADGDYWFTVVVVDREGRRDVETSQQTTPGLKVRVQSTSDAVKNDKRSAGASDEKSVRVGQIRIVGNDTIGQDVILRAAPIFPGQVLSYPELRSAERKLEQLNLFEVNPKTGIRPTITVVDPDSDSAFKDILIQVKEKRAPKH
jgi:hypothetical protein